MRCEFVRGLLQEHLDNQLPPTEAQGVQAHLAACAACRKELALLRQVDAALATLPVLDESADFTARVMARVNISPVFRLRWEDAVVSFAFAWAVMGVLFAFALLGSQDVSAAGVFLQQAWWTLLPELDRLWHIVQMEPAYAVWGLSSLCAAVVAAASAVVLVRQWPGRSMPKSTL
jgi:anti-sigma factor RsiW